MNESSTEEQKKHSKNKTNNIDQGITKQEVARKKKWASWVIYWLDINAVIYLEVIPQFMSKNWWQILFSQD